MKEITLSIGDQKIKFYADDLPLITTALREATAPNCNHAAIKGHTGKIIVNTHSLSTSRPIIGTAMVDKQRSGVMAATHGGNIELTEY